jgi:hypothetical protein
MSLFSLRGVAKLIEIVILLKDKLGHDITSRALITMYDSRTRYSRRVLEKVKEEFGSNVLETVIRYNIRLRETVDSGVPIGDYDKHSIGFKDYEDLAGEIIALGTAAMSKGIDSLNVAQDILDKAEGYIDTAAHEPVSEGEEFISQPYQSSYTEMVEAIAAVPADGIVEDEGEVE